MPLSSPGSWLATKLTPSAYPMAYHLHWKWNPFRPFFFVAPYDPCYCPVFGSVSASLSCFCSQVMSAQIPALLYISSTFDWGRWTPAPCEIKLPFCLTSWSVSVLTCSALLRPGWLRGKPQQTWRKSLLQVSLSPKYQEPREEAVGWPACSSRLPTNSPSLFYLPILASNQYLDLLNSASRAWIFWTFIANSDQRVHPLGNFRTSCPTCLHFLTIL